MGGQITLLLCVKFGNNHLRFSLFHLLLLLLFCFLVLSQICPLHFLGPRSKTAFIPIISHFSHSWPSFYSSYMIFDFTYLIQITFLRIVHYGQAFQDDKYEENYKFRPVRYLSLLFSGEYYALFSLFVFDIFIILRNALNHFSFLSYHSMCLQSWQLIDNSGSQNAIE